MIKSLHIIGAILLAACIGGCKSYAKYAIDKAGEVKIDSSLLGSWKAVEDTDKANFILVQSSYDMFRPAQEWHEKDTAEKRKDIYERVKDTARARFIWEGELDKGDAQYYESYYKFLAENNCNYYITYFNRHGRNPLYEEWTGFLSDVNKYRFLNIVYHNIPYVNGEFVRREETNGFFFVRLIKINATHDTITTAIIADTVMKNLREKQVREHIAKHVADPAFYSDTLHFYKVNDCHSSLEDAVSRANK